jgi:hypothetical protein
LSPRRKNNTPQHRLVLGKYVLDSLSAGMYSHPLMSLREYIQNSADAIDNLLDLPNGASISVAVDGRRRSLTIRDNGTGIPCDKARSTLLNVGCSEKDPTLNRGFRGIGRLGGLGYCDDLRFTTKSQGESTMSTCTWDCKNLRQLIADPSRSVDVESLIEDISTFQQRKYPGSLNDHFFMVEMNGLNNGRNELLNVPAIRSYLSQVAPVPFHPDFSLGQIIDKEVTTHVKSYRTYSISVNGEQIYKPYRDIITLSKGNGEAVRMANFVELQGESGMLGFGWLGELSLQGTVSASTDMDGLRLRYGNILIGDKETLSGFFRERRFNNYLVGEIHICGMGLIPNSRRDDFEDSCAKDELYSTFIREIGIPLSRKIRYLSQERSKTKSSSTLSSLFENAGRIIKYGYISELQREHMVKSLDAVDGNYSSEDKHQAIELLHSVLKSSHILSTLNSQRLASDDIIRLFNKTLEIVYAETSSREEAERMIARLYRVISEQLSDPSSHGARPGR